MGRRTLLLIASILVAAVGTALIALYVRGADARARAGTEQVVVQFAIQDIPVGTSAKTVTNGNYLRARTVRKDSVPPDPVGEDVSGLSGQTTVRILSGAPLQRSMFGEVTAAADDLGISKNRVAASFELSDPQRVTGMIKPGMYVSVYSVPQAGPAKRVIPGVKVLRVGDQSQPVPSSTASTSRTDPNADQVPRAVLTFDLLDAQERTLLVAQRDGDLALGLLGDQSIGNDP